ncbi:putative pre-mRNA splicing factor [Gregarina niphandrodes]|uniref:Pre-mRNA-processing factor 17 n=1 Tax=Gregarina niphandrodes TaxID=110365 RepID=A0A023B658_GRENI|nr:putative pre-mRNA splicing factor [Gregarina niphandrodes]EZG65627.1 putative pre-mRNA splicing factor [Gregarina niphandrodes]|eukprot:XP_011134069.1 putative pre-mRNA splicing factor [Gregarina niphandrodes]
MNILGGYEESDDETANEHSEGPTNVSSALATIPVRPDIVEYAREKRQTPADILATVDLETAQLVLPMYGPVRPSQKDAGTRLYQQHRNFELGHVLNCQEEDGRVLEQRLKDRDKERLQEVARLRDEKRRRTEKELCLPALGTRRLVNDDAGSEDYQGPWAPYEGEEARQARYKELMRENSAAAELASASKVAEEEKKKAEKLESRQVDAKFVFHLDEEKDYMGHSWIAGPRVPPKEVDEYALPKKVVHSYLGHTKPVLRMQFLPGPEHLLLSCSMDGSCKIWDVFNTRECVATYTGHSKAVKDLGFTNDGKRFYTCGLDTLIRQWDTETGQVISTFGNSKLPFSLAVHPEKNNVVVCGHQNRVAAQYDANTGKVEQEYTEHLSVVNTATFCEGGRRLATTSDDKKMYIWEFGMNVVVKHIAEPHMASMPAVTLDPQGQFLVCQSMDNQVLLYEATNRFRLQSRRRFRGHISSGYAIKPACSPDAVFLASGDVNGHLWVWDYKTCRMLRNYEAHRGALTAALWHTHRPSLLATCGWDGNIKLWE